MRERRAYAQTGRLSDGRFGTEVLLIRHGESASIVPGTPESLDPPLSEAGQQQAAALARRLEGRSLDAVYSSDLARARHTAELLAAPHALEVSSRPDLREVHLGEWEEGEFRRRAAVGDPEFLAFIAAGRWEVIPGAEPDEAVRDRIHGACAELAAAHAGGSVAIVCHGGVINAWLARQLGAHRSMVVAIDNASVTSLRTDGERWLVLAVNDTHHLGDPLLRTGTDDESP
jgi:2,3-bisphosphoglycerate-dependent phosphoglycerate mutase